MENTDRSRLTYNRCEKLAHYCQCQAPNIILKYFGFELELDNCGFCRTQHTIIREMRGSGKEDKLY